MAETRIEALTKRLEEYDKQLLEDLDRTMGDEAMFEAGSLKKEDVPAFVQYWFSVYPPQVWQHPDGHQEYGSIWAIEMRDNPAIENGKEVYDFIKEAL